jgi:hypothetical protein
VSNPIYQFKPHLEQKRKPILSKNVLDGLSNLAAYVEAGDTADVMGNDYEDLDAEGKATWRNVVQACEWIRKMQRYTRQKKERNAEHA